jgi:hypothetical protein
LESQNNGMNWQALINNGHGKKYIGTFPTEEEAARAYDLYSIALKGAGHRTNFGYTLRELKRKILNYFDTQSGLFDENL